MKVGIVKYDHAFKTAGLIKLLQSRVQRGMVSLLILPANQCNPWFLL